MTTSTRAKLRAVSLALVNYTRALRQPAHRQNSSDSSSPNTTRKSPQRGAGWLCTTSLVASIIGLCGCSSAPFEPVIPGVAETQLVLPAGIPGQPNTAPTGATSMKIVADFDDTEAALSEGRMGALAVSTTAAIVGDGGNSYFVPVQALGGWEGWFLVVRSGPATGPQALTISAQFISPLGQRQPDREEALLIGVAKRFFELRGVEVFATY